MPAGDWKPSPWPPYGVSPEWAHEVLREIDLFQARAVSTQRVPPFMAPLGEDEPWEAASNIVVPKLEGLDVGALAAAEGRASTAEPVADREATLEEVWQCLRDTPAQSNVERAEALLRKFRIVYR